MIIYLFISILFVTVFMSPCMTSGDIFDFLFFYMSFNWWYGCDLQLFAGITSLFSSFIVHVMTFSLLFIYFHLIFTMFMTPWIITGSVYVLFSCTLMIWMWLSSVYQNHLYFSSFIVNVMTFLAVKCFHAMLAFLLLMRLQNNNNYQFHVFVWRI